MNLEECIKYISGWYFSDTIELLDLVLDDDIVDPQYSAITTLNRLWIWLQYKKRTDKNYKYTTEDIALFRKKAMEERKIYTGDILNIEFLENLNSN